MLSVPKVGFPDWWSSVPNGLLSMLAVGISAIALTIAVKNYRRKSGLAVRGSFQLTSSVDCDDDFVSSIFLENLKDRAFTIFAIYLRVGHNYYLELETFETPLILKAFEAVRREYGPIQFYGVSLKKIGMNALLKDHKIRKSLVLSTADGQYVVPRRVFRWRPDVFGNHLTAVIQPVPAIYKGKYVGSNIRFIVEFAHDSADEEVSFIRHDDFRIQKFRNFRLTKESLETKASLEAYLQAQISAGTLICKQLTVHETADWFARNAKYYDEKPIEAQYYGRFYYHILGRFGTWLSDRELKKENAKLTASHKEQSS